MANVSLKTDFKDGEKLFGQQLNNNFSVIKAALDAANKIVWQDDPNDSVTAFRGTTEEINQRDVIDGQLLYDTTTGETYIDVGSQRISTGSGNAIHIGSDTPSNPSTQIWIDPNEPLQAIGTEVTNSMEGTESNKAPSVQAVKNYIDSIYSTDEVKTNKIWIDGKPIYRKMYELSNISPDDTKHTALDIDNLYRIVNWSGSVETNGTARSCFVSKIIPYVHYQLGNIYVANTGSETINSISVIIEYTKTNDSVGGE